MSTVNQAQATTDEPSEDSIADYLQSNPDFFERHHTLLGNLKLPHSTGGAAVSLVERQVAVLRQQNTALERRLRELVDVARSNDELAGRIHALANRLLRLSHREERIDALEEELRSSFSADKSVLVLFAETSIKSGNETQFFRQVRRDDPVIRSFKTFLQSSTPRCGKIRDSQRNYLFGADDIEIGSVALVPLGNKSAHGFLAIGSHNADHFHPGKSIDFLVRLGELVDNALR